MIKLPILFSMILLLSCSEGRVNSAERSEQPALEDYAGPTELATFAGGCFWCIEAPFEGIDGVAKVESGYSGGKEKNPTYGDVSAGRTGHKEVVQITYYPEVISYLELVDIFWQQFDPTDAGGSFYDRGSQYQSAIFYHNAAQKAVAEASKKRLDGSGKFDKPIVTPIEKFDKFYKAEAYHQDYYKKNPREYKAYRVGSGRDKFIKKHWPEISAAKYPKPSKSELKKQLTDLQYKVTQEDHTERAFANKYDANKAKGIYVCIVSGTPLFSSNAKFDSGTGWPSFTHPIDARFLTKPVDSSFGSMRVEVRSKYGDAHGGHVFYDGPKPTGLRYCMNSASLKFIAREEMENSGYSAYLWLVD